MCEAKYTGKQHLSATISNKRGGDDDDDDDDYYDDDGADNAEECNGYLVDVFPREETLKNSDLGNGVDAGAASNTSLISRPPENIKYTNFSRESEDGLDHALASNTTLNALSLTFSDENMSYLCAPLLGNGLASNTSLNTLTLRLKIDSTMGCSWLRLLVDGLEFNTSLKNLTVIVIYNVPTWMAGRESLGNGLERNKSLKNLTLIIENHSNVPVLEHNLCIDWAKNTSVGNLFLTVTNHLRVGKVSLGREFARKKSLKNLTLAINNFGELNLHWECCGLENESLNDFSLTINNYGHIFDDSIFEEFLSQFKSLTMFNLTLNLCGNGGENILCGLLEEAMINDSLRH
ncbi:uncharacterized protein [Montipora capricornis]|uniref:uncharacterized protein n=1 Tax=Montipora capricornis TaxID=246305 RepID=UPI0035F1EFA1